MRTTIVLTFCDNDSIHGEEEVAATTYGLGIAAGDGTWQWTAVDLCDPCAKPLVDIHAALAYQGRTMPAPGNHRASPERGEFTCPECGKTTPTRAGLGTHRSRMHGVRGKRNGG